MAEILSVVPQKFLPDRNVGWTDYQIEYDNQILGRDAADHSCEFNIVVDNVVSPDMALSAFFGTTQPTQPKRIQITAKPIFVGQLRCDLLINLDARSNRAFVDELPLIHMGDRLQVSGKVAEAKLERSLDVAGTSSATAHITIEATSAKLLPRPTTQPTKH
jgi:hypothetical protein